MSRYNFIASDYELPEIDLADVKKITVKELKKIKPQPESIIPLEELDENDEVLYFETEEDMDGLTIDICDNPPFNLNHYIKKQYVYWFNNRFTEKCAKQLIDYLDKNTKKSAKIEIWSICFGNEEEIFEVKDFKEISLVELNIDELLVIGDKEVCIKIIN